eukprot:UN03023
MVLTTRKFASQQYDASSIQGQGPVVLSKAAVCQMVGLIVQLGEVSQFALDIYQAIGYEVHRSATRIDQISDRAMELEDRLMDYGDLIQQTAPSTFFHTSAEVNWKRQDTMTHNLFAPESRPIPLAKLVQNTFAPPTISLMNEFAGKDCTVLYSDPSFFFNQWAQEEDKRLQLQREEKKKTRQGKSRRQKKALEQVKVEGIQVKVYSQHGKEFGQTTTTTATASANAGHTAIPAPKPVVVNTNWTPPPKATPAAAAAPQAAPQAAPTAAPAAPMAPPVQQQQQQQQPPSSSQYQDDFERQSFIAPPQAPQQQPSYT